MWVGSRRARAWAGLLALEALALAAYFAVVPGESGPLRYVLYPFVWINAGLWAVLQASPAVGSVRHRLVGLAVGAGYFLLVMAVAGNVALGAAVEPSIRVGWYVPGWGPWSRSQARGSGSTSCRSKRSGTRRCLTRPGLSAPVPAGGRSEIPRRRAPR